MVHGASPLGPLDPRWVQLCLGIVAAGFIVLSPQYPAICRLRLTAEQPDEVAATISAAAADQTLCPVGRPAVMSVSFSGGISIIAASRAPAGPLLTIGAYGDARRTLRALLTDPSADWYGVLIAIAHFSAPPLRAALLAVAEDDFHHHPPAPERYAAWLSRADATRFLALIGSPEVRQEVLLPLLAGPSPLLDALDATAAIPHLPAPLTLVHGTDDDVIPPSESRDLAARCAALGLPVRLVITPLISHGDNQSSPLSTLLHAPRLIGAVRMWMKEASATTAYR
jgi:pimeloyl-ACP methyl ester carboxylesterase